MICDQLQLSRQVDSCGFIENSRFCTAVADDGLAAVATVFVSLPGGQSPTVKLALASSLILLARQFPTGGRAFLRRRSTHAAPPT